MDPKVAEKYGLIDESEYWGGNEEDEDEVADDNPANDDPPKV
jgi:hypothetical protein